MKKSSVDEYGLTLQERQFCDHYVTCFKGTESAKVAGYTPSNAGRQATELLSRPHVEEYIKMRVHTMGAEKIAKEEEVLTFLTDVMRNDYQKANATRPFIPRDRIQCAELLGKRYAMWTDKVEQTQEVRIVVDLED